MSKPHKSFIERHNEMANKMGEPCDMYGGVQK